MTERWTRSLGVLFAFLLLTLVGMPAGASSPLGQSSPLGVTDAPCPTCAPQMFYICVHGGQYWEDYYDPE